MAMLPKRGAKNTKGEQARLQALAPDLTRSVLVKKLEVVVHFAMDNLRGMRPEDPIWSEPLDAYLTVCDKMLIESALLLLLLLRVPRLPRQLQLRVKAVGQMLAPRIRTARNRALLMRHPQAAAALSIGHLALEQCGEHDADFDLLLRRAWESGHVEATERLPYRAMDVRWIRAAFEDRLADYTDLMPQSILCSAAHPIQMSVADTYALTHALMYVTDFGAHRLPQGIDAERVGNIVEAGLACHLLTENLDLLGELLMSSAMLNRLESPYARAAWCLLTTAWDRLGFLPSPTFSPTEFNSAGERSRSYAFRHLYHTTFVAGMFCALLLRKTSCDYADFPSVAPICDDDTLADECERAVLAAMQFDTERCSAVAEGARSLPTADWHARSPTDADLSALLSFADRIAPARAPLMSDSAINIMQAVVPPHALFGVLCDAVLVRAAQEYDLCSLSGVLSLVSRTDAPVSYTAREAGAFLIRQTLPSGAIGTPFVIKKRQWPYS